MSCDFVVFKYVFINENSPCDCYLILKVDFFLIDFTILLSQFDRKQERKAQVQI